MSDSTTPSVSLSLPINDPRPLPEIIASTYSFALVFHEDVDVDPSHRWYSVQDWIIGVAKSPDPRRFWSGIKDRAINSGFDLKKLPYKATNSKIYKMDFAQAETLYLITQRMSVNSGIRNNVMHYLAKAGVKLDEIRRTTVVNEDVDITALFNIPLPQTQQKRHVYLFKRDDLYKIGIAKAPHRRSRGIQTQSGLAHELICSREYDNDFAHHLEKTLHQKYHYGRVMGEWFRLSEHELSNVIKAISTGEI